LIAVSRRKSAHFALAWTVAALFGLQQPAEAKDKLVIGVSLPNLDNPMWVRATAFANSVAKALGVDLVIVGAATHEDKQLSDVQSLISRNVDALVVVPVSIASSPGLLRVIDNAHVPVVVADRYPGFPAKNPNVPYLAFIGPNNITAGIDISNFLVAHGVKKMVALGGTPGDSNAEERKKGLEKAIADAKGVQLVQYIAAGETEDNGYTAMQNLLSAHPSGAIDGVWCYNDALCLGAYRAVKQAGRDKEIVLGGMDLTQPALDLIERKTNYIYSTGGHWLMIGFAEMIAYDALHGHAPLTDDIRMNLLGVDAKGFDVFKKEYIDSQPPYDIKQYTLTFNPNAKSQTFPMKLQ
jgi:ABC-type sugar transport system substrate-binding protein